MSEPSKVTRASGNASPSESHPPGIFMKQSHPPGICMKNENLDKSRLELHPGAANVGNYFFAPRS